MQKRDRISGVAMVCAMALSGSACSYFSSPVKQEAAIQSFEVMLCNDASIQGAFTKAEIDLVYQVNMNKILGDQITKELDLQLDSTARYSAGIDNISELFHKYFTFSRSAYRFAQSSSASFTFVEEKMFPFDVNSRTVIISVKPGEALARMDSYKRLLSCWRSRKSDTFRSFRHAISA